MVKLFGRASIACGVDIGSWKTACVIARLDPEGRIQILGSGLARPATPRRSQVQVADMGQTASDIVKAVEEAQGECDERPASAAFSLKGMHLESREGHGTVRISRSDRAITSRDVEEALEQAGRLRLNDGQEILQMVPRQFRVDSEVVADPLEIEATHLEALVQIFHAPSTAVNNILRAAGRAGLKVADVTPSILATADAVLRQEEKEMGCVLVDLGHQISDIAIYCEGGLVHTGAVALGADRITWDIAHALRCPYAVAEKIKHEYGATLPGYGDERQKITYTLLDGRSEGVISQKELLHFIAPRVEEIFLKIRSHIEASGFRDHVSGGWLVLAGGGSQLRGISEAAKKILDMGVRSAGPQEVYGSARALEDASFQAAIGLVRRLLLSPTARAQRFTLRSRGPFGGLREAVSRLFT